VNAADDARPALEAALNLTQFTGLIHWRHSLNAGKHYCEEGKRMPVSGEI
jgi:hypothetical protein